MLRRTELRRGTKPLRTRTALKPGKPLQRKTPLAQIGRKVREAAEAAGKPIRSALTARPRPTVPADKRAALEDRSGGICEMQLAGCTGVATDVCHRRTRGMGGRFGEAKEDIDQLSDTMHGCRTCHRYTHDQPAQAMDDGLRLKDSMNPLTEAVLYRGELSYLDDEGNVWPFEEVGP